MDGSIWKHSAEHNFWLWVCVVVVVPMSISASIFIDFGISFLFSAILLDFIDRKFRPTGNQ